jgi:hypothetical protein
VMRKPWHDSVSVAFHGGAFTDGVLVLVRARRPRLPASLSRRQLTVALGLIVVCALSAPPALGQHRRASTGR